MCSTGMMYYVKIYLLIMIRWFSVKYVEVLGAFGMRCWI
jgi:hypothetical protein